MPATPPDSLLFVSPGCPHCAIVLQGLHELLRQGLIGKLTVIDVAEHPEQAAEYGVRAAPWLRLGPFTLTGAHSPAELKMWAEWANGEEGTAHYVEHLLKQGGSQQAKAFIDIDTHRLKSLLAIVADPGAKLQVRLGVSALLEAHANSQSLQNLLPQLAELTRHADHRVRADACHLLGLTGSAAARTYVETCLKDAHEEVREIAKEAMERLGKKNSKT
jgi:hypothetical protein